MQEVPIDENPAALTAARRVMDREVDAVVFLTGVGATAWLNVVQTELKQAEFLAALRELTVAVRGPKPAKILNEWKVPIALKAESPNTWRELLTAFDDSDIDLCGKTVAVQEYGISNRQFYCELKKRNATVLPVPVYRWTLPDDTSLLESAIRKTIAGEFDAVIFTSANQIRNVVSVAENLSVVEAWHTAFANVVAGSIGPTCSEQMRATGLSVDVEASPPKMGPLIRATIDAIKKRRD